MSATYKPRKPIARSATIAAGSTTTTPSSSRPFTRLTGTTLMSWPMPWSPAWPCAMPLARNAEAISATIESGQTIARLRPGTSDSITEVCCKTAATSSSPSPTLTIAGAASPSRTAVGARNLGLATAITLSAMAMIWPGMRYPTDNPITRGSFLLGRYARTSSQSRGASGPVA